MTNELAFSIIAGIWLFTSRKLDLAFCITLYYLLYFASTDLPSAIVHVSNLDAVVSYYMMQATIDLSVITLCAVLSAKYQKFKILFACYAVMVGTSLFCDSMMMLDQAFRLGRLIELHRWRQDVACWIDLTFALLGTDNAASNFIRALPIRCWSSYNRRNVDQRNYKDW